MNQRQRKKILIVDDDLGVTDCMRLLLTDAGFDVQIAHTFAQAGAIFGTHQFDLVITDLCLPDGTGIDVITHVKTEAPETEVILMTGHGSLDITIEAIKRGAYYYLEKPCTPDTLRTLINRALEVATLKRENESLKRTLSGADESFGMIGRHPQLYQIIQIIRTTAPSDASVLIEGESGTGKELIAAAFHAQSHRSAGPFIQINCSAIPHELIESELFGYQKGAFTGADRDKRGLIEAANGGTLLLDEIAEMPAHLQTKLLRVLQERRLRRLGDEQELPVDFRLISSTNRDTTQMIKEGALRKDLYFRISTIKVKVPPLRERTDDVMLLAEHFLLRYAEKYRKRIRGVSQPAYALLARYDWPGNVRELESVVEHAVLFSQEGQIMPEDLPEQLHAVESTHFRCVIPPYVTMEEIEREAIAQTLERTGGNVKKTAQILDYHRPTLYRKLKKFGLMATAPAEDEGGDEAAADTAQGF